MVNKEVVMETLKTVIDPEIGMDLVKLGLIYKVEVKSDKVHILMIILNNWIIFYNYYLRL